MTPSDQIGAAAYGSPEPTSGAMYCQRPPFCGTTASAHGPMKEAEVAQHDATDARGGVVGGRSEQDILRLQIQVRHPTRVHVRHPRHHLAPRRERRAFTPSPVNLGLLDELNEVAAAAELQHKGWHAAVVLHLIEQLDYARVLAQLLEHCQLVVRLLNVHLLAVFALKVLDGHIVAVRVRRGQAHRREPALVELLVYRVAREGDHPRPGRLGHHPLCS